MIRAKNSFRKGGNQHKEENKFAEYDYTSKLGVKHMNEPQTITFFTTWDLLTFFSPFGTCG